MNPGWRRNYLRYQSFFLNVVARYKERGDVKAYIEILLSLVTISIFAIFALRPTLLTIAQLMKEIESKKETLEKMQNKIENLTSAQLLYDRERARVSILFNAIPDSPGPDIYARQIEGLSQRHQSKITGLSAGEAILLGKKVNIKSKNQKGGALPEGTVAMDISATYINTLDSFRSLADLLSDFEKSRRPAKIDTIRVKASSDEDKNKVLELSIEGRLPYFKGSSN